MNLAAVLRDSWRITWKNWGLWLLQLLLLLVFAPAIALSSSFGGVAALVALPIPGRAPFWLRQLRELPVAAWIGIAAAALLVLAATTAVSWMLQAATMRGAAMAAERGSFSVVEALKLGRQRLISLLTLSVIFGAIIGALGLMPPLLIILFSKRFEFAITLMNGAQTVLLPVNTVLGLVLLIVMMSVSLEDLKPGAAFKRGWKVFSAGWWAFVFVFGIAFALSFAVTLIVTAAALVLLVPGLVALAASIPLGAILLS
ncbi:MAG: hypothetical protein AAB382_05615, partial [Chloroflexota bacterium]